MLEDLLYVKEALGQHGEPLRVFKLRTMVKDAERLREEVKKNGRDQNGKFHPDPRVTPFGRILRRYWIDEIPQFYNVMRGDMSVVGIRPVSESEWHDYPAEHRRRALEYKPGLLGVQYALPSRRRSFSDMLDIQREYLDEKEQHPFLTDVKYFFKIWYNILVRGVRSS